MQRRKFAKLSTQSVTLTIVSLLGLCMLAVLAFYSQMPASQELKPWIGLSFIGICALGILAGVFPSRCSGMLHRTGNTSGNQAAAGKEADSDKMAELVSGHHPNCGSFSEHTFQLGSKTYCAGCMGLVVGAALAILGSSAYFFFGLSIQGLDFLVFWSGFFGVFLGIFQYTRFFVRRAFVHFILNVVFVFGTFLLLLGIVELNGSISLEVYSLSLALYWVLVRILSSQWEHKKICTLCASEHCRFFSRE